ncbi:hypothetical protein, partial [Leptospira santarosai]|uniref:hypothetical protein n=1 Tax=Leptospira santarosai TaxID=28183 RepID=UPI0024AE8A3B
FLSYKIISCSILVSNLGFITNPFPIPNLSGKNLINSEKNIFSAPEEEAISFLRFVTLYIDHCMIESSKRVLMPLYEEYFYKPMFFKHFIESSLKE